jgi:CDP-paratose 2-epimerase
MSTTLISGGAGFIGTNLADHLLRRGRAVRILDDLSRPGVEDNLCWLQREHGSRLDIVVADVRDAAVLRRAMRGVRTVFHLAAQVAVTTSFDDPLHDASVNLQGTLNLLEAARSRSRPPAILFTSTNKVYGSLTDVELVERDGRYEPVQPRLRMGIAEQRGLSFCTPYGCSKGAADQYVLDWSGSYRVPSVVFRMSCIYGPHQRGNEDQGWVAHFLLSALGGRPVTLFGDGKQVRDILFVDDLLRAFALAESRVGELSGRAFNIGGGPANAVSLLDVIEMIRQIDGDGVATRRQPWRPGDQRYYVSDTSAFANLTAWRPMVDPASGIRRLHNWLSEQPPVAQAAA